MRARLGALPLLALGVCCASAPVWADGVQVSLAGSHVTSVTSGDVTYPASLLASGSSSGAVSSTQGPSFPVRAADDLNLESYFVRSLVGNPAWRVDLGDWWDTNGSAADFFLFEVGGNDRVRVAPILRDGSVGKAASVKGWTPTGYSATTGPNAGQMVHGLAFGTDDLRDAGGLPLLPGERLRGLLILSSDIDGASFAAVSTGVDAGFQVTLPDGVQVQGQPRKWSPMEIWFAGPQASALDDQPNPFLDYRLNVSFTSPSGTSFLVPGFYDGDGRGGAQGNIWKVRFTPDETGPWRVDASFRSGTSVAVALGQAGQPASFDGLAFNIKVQGIAPSASGFHRRGFLQDVDQHYLRFQDGSWFLKGGTNSPENLLAYFGFDDVADSGNLGQLHRYAPHQGDWQPGDPQWTSATTGEDAKGLIGALNYLSSEGVNSVYLLPMNLGGDGQDVSPFSGQAASDFDRLHYNLGRLEQWNLAFTHAQSRGILLHLVLAETEPANETWLDGGTLGVQRKLFLRELSARFGHHNALQWNLCEENDWAPGVLDGFADYIAAVDPYGHPITVHNHPNDLAQYAKLAGNPRYAATSCQYSPDLAGGQVEQLRAQSMAAGSPWAVCMDENTPASTGLQPDNEPDLRKRVLWDVYFSGGAGVEWYFGYQPLPIGGDVDVEDFRTRAPMWRSMRIAREFVETWLPFPKMQPGDGLLSGESQSYGGGEVFCQPGEVYAVYLPSASQTGTLDLSQAPGVFVKRWFNPRSGLVEGPARQITGGVSHAIGAPPSSSGEDWVVWFEKI